MRKKRFCMVALALLLAGSSVLSGCKKKPGSGLLPAPTTALNNTGYMDDAAVTVDGVSVSYREAMLYLQTAKQEYESTYGSDIWQYVMNEDGSSLGEWVKDQTLEKIVYIKVVCAQAKKAGLELDSEERSLVAQRTEEYMRDAEYSAMALYGISRKDVENVYMDNALAQKMYDSVTLNVDTEISDEEAAQKHIQSLMIKNYHEDELGNRSALTVLELIAAVDRFDALYEEAQTTKDFYTLAFTNTEDKGLLDVWVGEGELPQQFAAAYDLKTGECMQIRVEDGYYIFYCASDFDEEATLAKKEELIALRQEKAFEEIYNSWRQGVEVQINEELWHAIGFDVEAQG